MTEREDQFDGAEGEDVEKVERKVVEKEEDKRGVEEKREVGEEEGEEKASLNIVAKKVHEIFRNYIRSREERKVEGMKGPPITKEDYYMMLRQYAMSHTRIREKEEKGYKEVEGKSDEDANRVYWLDENLDPETGKFYRIYRMKPCVFSLANCMDIYIYMCVCVCVCVCMYACMYACMYDVRTNIERLLI